MLIAVLMHAPVVVSQYALTPEGMSGREMFSYLLLYGAALWSIVVWVTRPARRGRHIRRDESTLEAAAARS
jgi:hypothetical protein